MNYNAKLYGVYDKVGNRFYTVGLATSAGAFVRDVGKMLYRVNSNFENEFTLYELCEFNEVEMVTSAPKTWKLISWDCYKSPETPAEKMENPDLKLVK